MPRIFICYRREDSIAHACRIYDRLSSQFGADNVFMDIDAIKPGVDFVEVLEQAVSSCDVLIAVIGRRWITAADEQGKLRLENPDDFVRLEIGAALERNIQVVPVLVGGSRMPRSNELPPVLSKFARRHALEVPDIGFHQALNRLVESIKDASSTTGIVSPAPRAGDTLINPKDGMTYVWIPSGNFTMGCSPGDTECFEDEEPPHAEQVANGFWLGQTPVTQAAWKNVMNNAPSYFKGDQLPIESVDWNQASAYCQAVGVRLPTEKEWEYAARASATGARYGALDVIAWHIGNSGGATHPVGQKQANSYGLYDTLGNVWEWTSDDYDAGRKAVRGGSWGSKTWSVRASCRDGVVPSGRGPDLGFRCIVEFR